jgi:hypothetical protein
MGTVFGLDNHLHLKELQILREIVYHLKYDKPGLSPFCFSGPDIRKCVPLFDACRQQQPMSDS